MNTFGVWLGVFLVGGVGSFWEEEVGEMTLLYSIQTISIMIIAYT